MASTWSNLGINLQGTGDNSGTWGQLTNVNLQDFDYAISGVAAITLTGNTTLAFTTNSSSTTYSNEAGRAAVLVLSGSLSATTVTVTVPNIQKNYVIINNSGATATISAGGSTTVSLGTSTSAYVYSNGSSSIFTAITSNPGGTTNQVQYNNAGAFAGSTNLTFNGTTLAIQTATALNLTATSLTATNATVTTDNITTANITTANVTTANVTSLTATNATVTTDNITTANITTANVTTANVTSLTAVTATTTTENVGNINLISNGTLKIYNTANSFYTGLKVAAGAATSATFTLPSADGTANQVLQTNGSGVLSFATPSSGSNTPAFLVTTTTAISVGGGAVTKIIWNTKTFDTNNAFDATTNYRFTVPSGQAGKYVFFVSNGIYSSISGRTSQIRAYLNGSDSYATYNVATFGTTEVMVMNSFLFNLSVGDYVETYIYSDNDAGKSTLTNTSSYACYWYGFKLL